MKKASRNLHKLDKHIHRAIRSLVRFGIEGAENPDYRIFLAGKELVLAVHLDRFPEWKRGSIAKGFKS
ncbi:MAG TPA: hypothetical protein VGS11_04555 [Candidatus Bathyarchaeia archaeon]|nr:hypothetical protein [Candidatus Bathyarchaeia archaeon]